VGVTTYRIHEHPRIVELTRSCLRSVLSQGCDVQLILHDQCSHRKTVDGLLNEFRGEIYAFFQEEVSGLSRAFNNVCRWVFQLHPLIVLLNNDVILLPGSLKALLEFEAEAENKGKLIYGDTYTFSAFLLPRTVYAKIGAFDEWYRFSTEDWDYMKRLRNAGVQAVRCPGFKVKHEERATRKYIKEDWESLDRVSEAHFYAVHGKA